MQKFNASKNNHSLYRHNYLLQIQEENRTVHQRGLLGEEELLVQRHPALSKTLKGRKKSMLLDSILTIKS